MNITSDQQIIEYLKARHADHSEILTDLIASTANGGFIACHRDINTTSSGATIDDAIANLRAKIGTPEQQAEQKREQARKLMAEADKISPPVYCHSP